MVACKLCLTLNKPEIIVKLMFESAVSFKLSALPLRYLCKEGKS